MFSLANAGFHSCEKVLSVFYVSVLLGYGYYAYVVVVCFFTVDIRLIQIFYIVFYHLFLFMFIWAYLRTTLSRKIVIPDTFGLPEAYFEPSISCEEREEIVEATIRNLPIYTLSLNGKYRICSLCRIIKPDRAHHCSICKICVLKMDHHCPWVINCVCFSNYKYFILMILYGIILCFYVTATTLPYLYFILVPSTKDFRIYHTAAVLIVSAGLGLLFFVFFCYHCNLMFSNRTSLEYLRPQYFVFMGTEKSGYDIGKCNNFKQVFGNKPFYWWLPTFTSLGNGTEFPLRQDVQDAVSRRLTIPPPP